MIQKKMRKFLKQLSNEEFGLDEIKHRAQRLLELHISESQKSDSLPCVRLSLPSENDIKLEGFEKFPNSYNKSEHYQNGIKRNNWAAGAIWLRNKLISNKA
jgi:hypothetical protein